MPNERTRRRHTNRRILVTQTRESDGYVTLSESDTPPSQEAPQQQEPTQEPTYSTFERALANIWDDFVARVRQGSNVGQLIISTVWGDPIFAVSPSATSFVSPASQEPVGERVVQTVFVSSTRSRLASQSRLGWQNLPRRYDPNNAQVPTLPPRLYDPENFEDDHERLFMSPSVIHALSLSLESLTNYEQLFSRLNQVKQSLVGVEFFCQEFNDVSPFVPDDRTKTLMDIGLNLTIVDQVILNIGCAVQAYDCIFNMIKPFIPQLVTLFRKLLSMLYPEKYYERGNLQSVYVTRLSFEDFDKLVRVMLTNRGAFGACRNMLDIKARFASLPQVSFGDFINNYANLQILSEKIGADCPICLYQDEDKVLHVGCHTVFCKICFDTWKNSNQTCPLCRSDNPIMIEVDSTKELVMSQERDEQSQIFEEFLDVFDKLCSLAQNASIAIVWKDSPDIVKDCLALKNMHEEYMRELIWFEERYNPLDILKMEQYNSLTEDFAIYRSIYKTVAQ